MSDVGEFIACKYLYKNGWDPERSTPSEYGTGVPDFKCSEKRWVELKNLPNMNYVGYGNINLNLNQLQYWKKLIDNEEKVFLMIADVYSKSVTKPLDITNTTMIEIIDAILDLVDDR